MGNTVQKGWLIYAQGCVGMSLANQSIGELIQSLHALLLGREGVLKVHVTLEQGVHITGSALTGDNNAEPWKTFPLYCSASRKNNLPHPHSTNRVE